METKIRLAGPTRRDRRRDSAKEAAIAKIAEVYRRYFDTPEIRQITRGLMQAFGKRLKVVRTNGKIEVVDADSGPAA